MSKDELADWSETAANNTDVGGISIGEGMNPGDVNGALREIMRQLAVWFGTTGWDTYGKTVPTADLDDITNNGVYNYDGGDANVPKVQNGVVLHLARASSRGFQIAATATSGSHLNLFWREQSGQGWSAWREIWHVPVGASDVLNLSTTGLTVSSTSTAGLNLTAAEYGFFANADTGGFAASRLGNVPAIIKRSNDGALVSWYTGVTLVGSVSASGGVVTYGSFCGAHWSQFRSQARPNVLRGTILETIDRFCEWPGETENVLAQVDIARPGSRAVYGVFANWDEDTRDISVASLGAFTVRMAPGQTVAGGDLIEAGPNGCGVVQADDVFRSSTVAKVTAAVVTEVYPDGSFLVPCTLHCG